MSATATAWGFTEGAAITPELTALRLLGGGSAYEAYLAFDELTHTTVVAKVVRPDLVDDAHALHGLRREVTGLEIANHPSVVRLLRHELGGERPHLVMENVDGPRLSSLIRRHGRLAPEQYLVLGIEVASALHFFAHADVVHLDIKPSNVIMGAPAKLIDLSIARSSGHAAGLDVPIGTDPYMAPEQCRAGSGDVGPVPGFASDVWGLGATLFHAVAGRRPFESGRTRFPQLADEPDLLPAEVPDDVAGLVYAMLHVDPADRPSPHQIVEVLESALARRPRAKLTFKVRR